MAAVSAALVKELREKTGAGMLDCKNALAESGGDMDAAVDWLRKKGLSKAAKKADRAAAEGLVAVAVTEDGKKGALVEVNSETDFVARNEEFQAVVRAIADAALQGDGDVEALKAAPFPGGSETVADRLTAAVAKIGENMNLRRCMVVTVEDGVVASYVHNAVAPGLGKIGVLVAVNTGGDGAKADAFGRQVAMHVAATGPLALTPDDLDPAVVAREKDVLSAQARESGKPEGVIEKMVEGRLRKFFEETVLLKQAFVINPDLTVEKAADEAAKDVGAPVAIAGFAALKLGEGVEKEETDFAAEVAAAVKG